MTPTSLALRILDWDLVLRCPDSVLAAVVADLLTPFVSPQAVPSATVVEVGEEHVAVDGTVVARCVPDLRLAHLVQQLNRGAVQRCGDLAVHAGVFTRRGRLVAVPAVSGAGKSTLTAAACRSGWGYVSDEALVLASGEGTVRAYPKPVTLSTWSAAATGLTAASLHRAPTSDTGERELIIAPRHLGPAPVALPLLSDIVVPVRGAGHTGLTSLPGTGIVALLLGLSFNHYHDPGAALVLVGALARRVRLWRLDYEDPLEAAELLTAELLGAQPL